MAKTVNLTAVEKLSTYNEHTNLIVEQEGELNRVAIADLKISSSEIYKQDEEPIDAPEGALWIDTDEKGGSGGGGVSSWNDLTDKPFGETITTSDTLTWNGDITGLFCALDMHYLISNDLLTEEDLTNGYELIISNGLVITNVECPVFNDSGNLLLGFDGETYSIPGAVLIYQEDIPQEQRGIYFTSYQGMYVTSLRIPNHTFEIKEIKKLDKKYLPDTMPEVTAEDNGKFMRVVDGKWVAEAIPYAEEASF